MQRTSMSHRQPTLIGCFDSRFAPFLLYLLNPVTPAPADSACRGYHEVGGLQNIASMPPENAAGMLQSILPDMPETVAKMSDDTWYTGRLATIQVTPVGGKKRPRKLEEWGGDGSAVHPPVCMRTTRCRHTV